MIRNLLATNIYVKVYKNKLVIRLLDENQSEKTFAAQNGFTTERLLVGNFIIGEDFLKKSIKEILPKKFFTQIPSVLIQPMEMIEGGLSDIESRVFRELALGAGAVKVALHVGQELTKSQAIERLRNA